MCSRRVVVVDVGADADVFVFVAFLPSKRPVLCVSSKGDFLCVSSKSGYMMAALGSIIIISSIISTIRISIISSINCNMLSNIVIIAIIVIIRNIIKKFLILCLILQAYEIALCHLRLLQLLLVKWVENWLVHEILLVGWHTWARWDRSSAACAFHGRSWLPSLVQELEGVVIER